MLWAVNTENMHSNFQNYEWFTQQILLIFGMQVLQDRIYQPLKFQEEIWPRSLLFRKNILLSAKTFEFASKMIGSSPIGQEANQLHTGLKTIMRMHKAKRRNMITGHNESITTEFDSVH